MSIRKLRIALCVALLCGLAGCASVGRLATLQPGISSEADATSMAGRKPDFVWNNPDGTRTLEYSNQALDGNTAYKVIVGTNGKVIKTERIIVDPATTRIDYGMPREQVRKLLGSPRTIVNFPLSGEEVWDWNTSEVTMPGYLVRFNVHFKKGKVVRTSTRTIDKNDCSILSPC